MNRKVIVIGAIVTVPIIVILAMSFGHDPHSIKTPMIGRPAPQFTLRDVETNKDVSLASFRGKTVVVNFWATWCVPCFQEHETLVSTARSVGSNVQFIGIVYDDTPDKIREFLQQYGQAYPHLVDASGQTAIAYGVYGVPETFFVNPKGVIAEKFTGPISPGQLMAYIQKASS